MKCAIAHPNIAPYIKESVLAYQEYGVLDKFYTTYFQHSQYPFTQRLIRLFPRFEKEFKRRNVEEIDFEYLSGHPFYEMLRILSARFSSPRLENRMWQWNELNFDRWVAGNLQPGIRWIHTYEHAALATIRRARALNILSFYEQPSQHHTHLSRMVNEQLNQYPELSNATTRLLLNQRALDSQIRKNQELQECDFIICNSAFTLRTLTDAGLNAQKIICIPYGFPEVSGRQEAEIREKITFLFAGSQILRKGIHLLYKAWIACNFDPEKAQLIIIGKNHLPQSLRQGLPASVKFIGNIPHDELNHFYRQADVFVFPTLADGFGMVISEAMAMGLPVITTTNSGGPDIITHNHNGWLIEASRVEPLVARMKWCFEHPEQLKRAGRLAMETAESYPWRLYRSRLIEEVSNRVCAQPPSPIQK